MGTALLADEVLWKVFQRPSWSVSINQDKLILDCPNELTAKWVISLFLPQLAQSTKKLGLKHTLVKHPNQRRPYRVLPNMTDQPIITVPGLEISDLSLTPALLPWLAHFLENPEIKGGVIRLRDEKQIVLSNAIAPILRGGSLKSATNRKRQDFWHLPDLEEMRLAVRDSGSSFEFSYRCHGSDQFAGIWFRNFIRYQQIEDSRGEIYQKFEILDCQEVAAP